MTDHIVHVGMHKTGSTWLQRAVFPTVHGATFLRGPIFKALLRNLAGDDFFFESTLRSAISEGANGRALLSFEGIAGNPWGEEPFDPDRGADRLQRVVPTAQIVLVTRQPDSLARSLYAQYIHEGGFQSRRVFEESTLLTSYLDMDRAIDRFRSRFDRLLVLRYEQLQSDPAAFIHHLEDYCDISFTCPVKNSTPNASLRGWRLAVLRRWNRMFRKSALNPRPPLPIPYAGVMRTILQKPARN